ncbi:MAG: hypothetical protein AAF488_17070, partial [Planctomycetota bacterium]
MASNILAATGIGGTAATAIVAGSIVVSGLGIVAGGSFLTTLIASSFIDEPSVGGSQPGPGTINPLQQLGNQATPDQPFTRIYGKRRFYPARGGRVYTRVINGRREQFELFAWEGPTKIENVKLGDTPIEEILPEDAYQFREGWADDPTRIEIYSDSISQAEVNERFPIATYGEVALPRTLELPFGNVSGHIWEANLPTEQMDPIVYLGALSYELVVTTNPPIAEVLPQNSRFRPDPPPGADVILPVNPIGPDQGVFRFLPDPLSEEVGHFAVCVSNPPGFDCFSLAVVNPGTGKAHLNFTQLAGAGYTLISAFLRVVYQPSTVSEFASRTTSETADEVGIELLWPRGLFLQSAKTGNRGPTGGALQIEFRHVGEPDEAFRSITTAGLQLYPEEGVLYQSGVNDALIGFLALQNEPFSRGLNFRPLAAYPEWAASTAYTAGDFVTYEGELYSRASDGSSGALFDQSQWEQKAKHWEIQMARVDHGERDFFPRGGASADSLIFANECVWQSLQSISYGDPINDAAGVATIALRNPVDEAGAVNGLLNLEATSYLPRVVESAPGVYEIEHPESQPLGSRDDYLSRNGSDAMIHAAINGELPQTADGIDLAAFYDWRLANDPSLTALAPLAWDPENSRHPRNTDLEFRTEVIKRDAFRMITRNSRASFFEIFNRLTVVVERPRDPATELGGFFSAANSANWSFRRRFDEVADAIRTLFTDESEGYSPRQLLTFRDGFDRSNATRYLDVRADGVQDAETIRRDARLMFATAESRPDTQTFDTGLAHLGVER